AQKPLDLETSRQEEDEDDARQQAGGGGDDYPTALQSLQRRILKTAQEMREVVHATAGFWLTPAIAHAFLAVRGAGKCYGQKVRSAEKGHKRGPPRARRATPWIESTFNELTETMAQEGPKQNIMWALDIIGDDAANAQGKGNLTLAFNHSHQFRLLLEDKQVDETELDNMGKFNPQHFRQAAGFCLARLRGAWATCYSSKAELERAVERQLQRTKKT
ncbi:unnamed protein product, partial [Prorocentrum cordatum]